MTPQQDSPERRNRSGAGFTLVEVLAALFIIGLGLLSVAPLFIYALHSSAAVADLGSAGAVAVERMEILRASDYTTLVAGGSLTSNDAGYSDTGHPELFVRWTVADNTTPPNTKTIVVRVAAKQTAVGTPKQVELTLIRAK